MGLHIGFSSCSNDHNCTCTEKVIYKQNPVNPNPSLFDIKSMHHINGYTIVYVIYPNCTNFEGKKVLVFEGDVIVELTKAKKIDPHFFENKLSPVARFAPSEKGLKALDKLIG